jgi:hypothetical protein
MSAFTLLLHPCPGVLTDAALRHLQSEHQVIVPNHRAGLAIQRRSGRVAATLTLTGVAAQLLEDAGWQLQSRLVTKAVLRTCCQDISLTYLGPLLNRPSTLPVIQEVITELQRAHVLPDTFLNAASTEREHDLARIYACYIEQQRDQKLFDWHGAEHYASSLALAPRPGLVDGYAAFDPAQLAFLARLLSPGSVVTLPCDLDVGTAPSTESRDALIAQGWTAREVIGASDWIGDQAALTFLSGTLAPTSLFSVTAPSIEIEVRAALRQVRAWLAQGTALEDIALLTRQVDMYAETLSDIANEYRIPLVFGQRGLHASIPPRNLVSTSLEPCGVQVLDPLSVVGSSYARVWVLGLADSVFPRAQQDHPLLDLHARTQLRAAGIPLRDVRQLGAAEASQFHMVLTAAREDLVLSAPQSDAQGRPLYLSPFLERLGTLPAPPSSSPVSRLEVVLDRAQAGQLSSSQTGHAATEAARVDQPQGGDFGQIAAIQNRNWTLQDLQQLNQCPFRWLVLGHFGQVRRDVRQDAVLHAAFTTAAASPAQRLTAARLANLQADNSPLGTVGLLDRALQGRVLCPTAQPLDQPARHLTTTIRVAGTTWSFTLSLGPVIRGDLTLFGPPPTGYSALSPDAWMGLCLQATGASGGTWYDLDTNTRTHRLVAGSTADQAAQVALYTWLADLAQRLAQGHLPPTPSYAACSDCSLGAVCRAQHLRGRA